MKFIATQGFVQGLQNPLGIQGTSKYISQGMVMNLNEEQLKHKDVTLFLRLGQLVPIDSERGKQLEAQNAKIAQQAAPKSEQEKPQTDWARIGAIATRAGIAAAVLIYLATYLLSR